MHFDIDLSDTSPTLKRFHRKLMDRQALEWESFDGDAYDDETREHARVQWAGRAVAEYASAAQFARLLVLLTKVGAPLELIGAATRLIQDETRHADICARMADRLGGRSGYRVNSAGLRIFEDADPWVAIYRTILEVCCFGEVLSVPMLRAIESCASDPLAQTVASIIGNDEEYHARFGWEALELLTPRLNAEQKTVIANALPDTMGGFEQVCVGSPELIASMAGVEIEIGPKTNNLGTLTDLEYAAIFYDTMDSEILPNLTSLGFDAIGAWRGRRVPSEPNNTPMVAIEVAATKGTT